MTINKPVEISHESYPYNRNKAQALYRSTADQVPTKRLLISPQVIKTEGKLRPRFVINGALEVSAWPGKRCF